MGSIIVVRPIIIARPIIIDKMLFCSSVIAGFLSV